MAVPSYLASLVLGYLDDCDCKESCRIFLRESPDLEERRAFVSRGISPTSNLGISLIDIFEDYFETKEILTNLLSKVQRDLLGKVRRNDSLSTITRQMVKLVPKSNSVIRQVSGGYSYKSGLRRSRLESPRSPEPFIIDEKNGEKLTPRDRISPAARRSSEGLDLSDVVGAMLADASFHEEVANKINQVRSSSEKLPDVEELVEKLIPFTAPKRDLPSKRRGRRLEEQMNGRDTNPPEVPESMPNEVLITLLPPLPQTSSEQPSLRSLSRLQTPDFTQEQGATEAKNERYAHTGPSLDFDTVLNAATIPQEGVSILPSFSQKIESSPTQKELTLPSENVTTAVSVSSNSFNNLLSGAETLVDQKLENSKINACDVVLIPEIDDAQMPCLATNQPKESTDLKSVKVTSKEGQDFPVISIDTQDTLFKNLTNQLQGNEISLSSLFKVEGTSGQPDKQDKPLVGRKEQNSHSVSDFWASIDMAMIEANKQIELDPAALYQREDSPKSLLRNEKEKSSEGDDERDSQSLIIEPKIADQKSASVPLLLPKNTVESHQPKEVLAKKNFRRIVPVLVKKPTSHVRTLHFGDSPLKGTTENEKEDQCPGDKSASVPSVTSETVKKTWDEGLRSLVKIPEEELVSSAARKKRKKKPFSTKHKLEAKNKKQDNIIKKSNKKQKAISKKMRNSYDANVSISENDEKKSKEITDSTIKFAQQIEDSLQTPLKQDDELKCSEELNEEEGGSKCDVSCASSGEIEVIRNCDNVSVVAVEESVQPKLPLLVEDKVVCSSHSKLCNAAEQIHRVFALNSIAKEKLMDSSSSVRITEPQQSRSLPMNVENQPTFSEPLVNREKVNSDCLTLVKHTFDPSDFKTPSKDSNDSIPATPGKYTFSSESSSPFQLSLTKGFSYLPLSSESPFLEGPPATPRLLQETPDSKGAMGCTLNTPRLSELKHDTFACNISPTQVLLSNYYLSSSDKNIDNGSELNLLRNESIDSAENALINIGSELEKDTPMNGRSEFIFSKNDKSEGLEKLVQNSQAKHGVEMRKETIPASRIRENEPIQPSENTLLHQKQEELVYNKVSSGQKNKVDQKSSPRPKKKRKRKEETKANEKSKKKRMLKCTSEIATEDLIEKDKPTKKETCSDVEVDEKTLFTLHVSPINMIVDELDYSRNTKEECKEKGEQKTELPCKRTTRSRSCKEEFVELDLNAPPNVLRSKVCRRDKAGRDLDLCEANRKAGFRGFLGSGDSADFPVSKASLMNMPEAEVSGSNLHFEYTNCESEALKNDVFTKKNNKKRTRVRKDNDSYRRKEEKSVKKSAGQKSTSLQSQASPILSFSGDFSSSHDPSFCTDSWHTEDPNLVSDLSSISQSIVNTPRKNGSYDQDNSQNCQSETLTSECKTLIEGSSECVSNLSDITSAIDKREEISSSKVFQHTDGPSLLVDNLPSSDTKACRHLKDDKFPMQMTLFPGIIEIPLEQLPSFNLVDPRNLHSKNTFEYEYFSPKRLRNIFLPVENPTPKKLLYGRTRYQENSSGNGLSSIEVQSPAFYRDPHALHGSQMSDIPSVLREDNPKELQSVVQRDFQENIMIKKDKAFSEDSDPETSRRLYIDYDSHGNESLVSKNKTVSSKSKSRESAESAKPLMASTPFRTSVSKKKGNSIKVNKTSSSLISNGGSYVTVYQKRMASKRKNAPPSSSTSKVNLNVNWTCDRLVQPSFKVVDIRIAEVESSAQNLRSQGDFRVPKINCNLINKTNYNRVHSKKYKISQGSSSKVDLEECKSKVNDTELIQNVKHTVESSETCINGMSLPSPLKKILSRLSSRDVVVESFCPRDVMKETLKGLSLENTLVSETPVPTSKIIYSSKGEPPKVENVNCETVQCRKNDSTHSNIFVDLKDQLKILSSNPSISPEKRRVLKKLSVTNAELFDSNSVPSKSMNNYNSEEVSPTKPRKERTGDLYDFLYS